MPTQTRLRRLALVILSGATVVSTVAAVHAQEGGFLEQLFGVRPAPQPVAPVQPAWDPRAAAPQSYRARRHIRSSERPRARYVALPADPDKILGKQPVDSKAIAANPTAAIMKDETLRPGDIVVLPTGPKVFTGAASTGKRHRAADFEDVRQSRSVDKKTRALLLAMMVPHGAMPAAEARKYLAKARKLAPAEDIAPLERQARNESGARVINVWNAAR
ncbi:hypothetical protein [Methylobacterium organophilum]|uniref:Uncharacterized protein n=1 Tax=Methylobacterium organophilum TaxID=410 RepID=A0ABQ4TD17_METOR|nr:hypothetical protein [Methylobacterium organophilum]GJE28805.1 hypothetical protein LKMONMHP_3679 [Methylobacterium organophilum]